MEKLQPETLSSEQVLHFFKEINMIPRGSGNEEAESRYLYDFAVKRGLFAHRDSANNVIIKKAGTKGKENLAPVALQGHMDMVCEKREDVIHDFEKDPIKYCVENGYIHADGTTLGADDGIAVAMALALLDSDTIPHPPLEVLVTTDEEVGMLGAAAFDPSYISARRMINIDSEIEGVFTVGCAGGVKTHSHIPVTKVKTTAPAYVFTLGGLQGGHSGIEIHKERGNANKLIFRLFAMLKEQLPDLALAEVSGGAKDNAIPRNAKMTVSTSASTDKIKAVSKTIENIFNTELTGKDKLEITLEKTKSEFVFDEKSTAALLAFAAFVPNGVQTNNLILNMPESSNNLGVVKTHENEVEFICALRSGTASLKEMMRTKVEMLTKLCGGTLDCVGDYPGWEFNKSSKLLDLFVKEYTDVYGSAPVVETVHAGLECGLIGKKIPDMDMISIGPNLLDIHTPQERAEIASIERVWKFLLHILDVIE